MTGQPIRESNATSDLIARLSEAIAEMPSGKTGFRAELQEVRRGLCHGWRHDDDTTADWLRDIFKRHLAGDPAAWPYSIRELSTLVAMQSS